MARMAGGWSVCMKCPSDLSLSQMNCIKTALNSLTGASYEVMFYVGSQVVNGTNHLLICKQTTTTNPPEEHIVAVVVNQPISGNCTVVSVKPLH